MDSVEDFNSCFHAVVVFGLGKDLLFISVLGHCIFYSSYCESQIESFKVPSVGLKKNYPELFSICLI